LDFAGPFDLKAQGRGIAWPKTYLLLMTCPEKRVIHLELTVSMTMSATLNVISRFIDIRGMLASILSDNFVIPDKSEGARRLGMVNSGRL